MGFKMRCYHSTKDFLGQKYEFIPKSILHEADRDGKLVYKVYSDMAFFTKSNEPVLCCAKIKAGSIVGAITAPDGNFYIGPLFIYRINDEPDVDLSNANFEDFRYIKEVRFKRPVLGYFIQKFIVTEEITNYVLDCYPYYPGKAVDFIHKKLYG